MNPILARWNDLPVASAAAEVLPCCGSCAWAEGLAARRPLTSTEALSAASDAVWLGVPREAWLEAFASHPRIGQTHAKATAQSLAWSAGEQAKATADDEAKAALAEGNGRYEAKFGRIFIVCASGKSASEMLAILDRRLHNDAESELIEAAEQQRQITQLRLAKWLGQEISKV